MPNISINELQLLENIDGSQVFANVDRSNTVTYQSKISSIFYDNSVKTNTITDGAVNITKIAGNSVNNEKILNTDDFAFNTITLNSPSNHFTARGLSYTFPAQREANKFLKHTSEGVLEWATAAEVAGGGSTNAVVANDSLLPVGSIVQWGSNDAPTGWLLCNGSTFDGTVYPDLSAVVNENFGARDGNNFVLPDLRGKLPLGIGSGTDEIETLSTFTIGSSGGEYSHQLTDGEMLHNHVWATYGGTGNDASIALTTNGFRNDTFDSNGNITQLISDGALANNPAYTSRNGRDSSITKQLHNNIPPFLAVNYIIKAKPTTLIDFNPILGGGLSAIDSNNIINTENFNLSSKEIGIFKDDNQFQYDGDGKLQLKERKILTDTQYVGVNSGTIDINLCSCSSRTGLQYCLCDFTDSSNILNETTRCDIRGVYICTCTFNFTEGENPRFTGAGILSNGATEYRRFAGNKVENGDDDHGIVSETFLPINAGETSFKICHSAHSDRVSVKTTIVGVQINKYI